MHAPFQSKQVSNKHSPWIIYKLTYKIYIRNYMKKIAIQEKSATAWERYKQARNEVNNAIKWAKNSILRITWKWIKWILEKHGYWLTT